MTDNKTHQHYTYYGTKSTAEEVEHFILHLLKVSQLAEKDGRKRIPICIWGKHGIGKTELVEAFAKNNGYAFQYIAPAQFEEMGDLLGMPQIENNKTTFAIPAWVPTGTRPGILLIDDINRADGRILRGIMQLLLNYELVSWKLPANWHIILTANPDGGDYAVTPMDDAMITRMMHITMAFNVKSWAKWATKSGVDERGITFVLRYPEIISGTRTTPRTLVQFFETIAGIANLQDNIGLVQSLADACLDETTATTFISFVRNNLSQLITPDEILLTANFSIAVEKRLHELVIKGGILRVDILATICTRLVNTITLTTVALGKKAIENIQQFILMDFLPNDLRLGMLQDIAKSKKIELKKILSHPSIGKLLLDRM